MSSLSLILLITVIANLPWISERLFLAIPLAKDKSSWLRLFELVVFYFISLAIAIMTEKNMDGGIHPQNWEFYATTFSGFLVLAVPGVVYRYQWLTLKQK